VTGNVRYQKPDEARAAIYNNAMEMYQKGEIGGVRHLLNDWVHGVFGLQSMKDYFGSGIFSEAAHALLYDFNPLAIAASTIVQTAFSLFPQGTIDLLFGGGSVAQQGTVGSDYSNTLVNSWDSYSNITVQSPVYDSGNSTSQSNPSFGGDLDYGSYDDFFWDWDWWW